MCDIEPDNDQISGLPYHGNGHIGFMQMNEGEKTVPQRVSTF